MKIAYIAHTRFPTEKAHGHQIAQVCEALLALKHDVTVIAPDIASETGRDAQKYYHLQQELPVKRLRIFDALSAWWFPGKLAFRSSMRSYRRALRKALPDMRFDLLYCRTQHVLPALIGGKARVILELHTLPRRRKKRFAKLCNQCTKVVCLTTPMREELIRLGVTPTKVIVEGDAVDLDRFAKLPNQRSIKHHFGVPEDRTVVGYVGSLVTMDKLQKGVDVLIKAIASFKSADEKPFLFIVGGPMEWVKRYRIIALHAGLTDDDFRFQGVVQSKNVPDAIAACDICVYPAPRLKHAFFRRDTSPLKLFEYMAAGKPIVCAHIPPLEDVVDEKCVRIVQPGDPRSMAMGIRDLMQSPKAAKALGKAAQERVRHFTWHERMKRIMASIK